MSEYYANHDVRARIGEFLGGTSADDAACVYVTCGDVISAHHLEPRPLQDLESCFQGSLDISRSLWDRGSLLAHLDVEYVNFDAPAAVYLEPERAFELQEPVVRAIEALLLGHGITPFHLLSGRGHHFTWRLGRHSKAFQQLTRLGRVPPSLKRFYEQPHVPTGETVDAELGAAFAGLGQVMEYLGHHIKSESARTCSIPVELAELPVGPRVRDREMISVDLSEYGDPLTSRVIRAPFSFYLKPVQQQEMLGDDTVKDLPRMFLVPLFEMDWRHGLTMMRDPDRVAELAARAPAKIPDQSEAMEGVIAAYAKSPLRDVHDWFYSQELDPPEAWPQTYDQTPLDALPACGRFILERPNDLLLKPACLQRVTRIMLALGWHPRHIAGLIRSKYERDFGWGDIWRSRDPSHRADFYVRLFTGLFAVGNDDLVDFNCQSAKEEKMCFLAECPDNLEQFKQSLLERRHYERLASRPFNRLFSSPEHP